MIYLVFILLILGCDPNEDIKSYQVQKSPLETKKIESKESSSNLDWSIPKGWIKSSGAKMRLASFNVPFSGGYGDLSVMTLSGDGGGIEANINRWRAQINLEPQNISDINKNSEKRNNPLGDYQIFKIINSQNKDKAFICAIMPSKKNTVFIKLSISTEGIYEVKDDFITFCDSFKLIDG